jgi:hypothetical protein
VEADTNSEITQLTIEYKENKDKVVQFLLSNIMKVNLEIPRVLKGDFDI